MAATSSDAAASKGSSKKQPSSSHPRKDTRGASILTKYFLVLLLLFGVVMVFVNHRLTQTVLNDSDASGDGYDDDGTLSNKIHDLSRALKRLKRQHQRHHKKKHSVINKLDWANKFAAMTGDGQMKMKRLSKEGAEYFVGNDGFLGKDSNLKQDSLADSDKRGRAGRYSEQQNIGDRQSNVFGFSDQIPDDDPEKNDLEQEVKKMNEKQEVEKQNGGNNKNNAGGEEDENHVPLAGLDCKKYHALEQDHNDGEHMDKALTLPELKAAAEEMVYWKDIPQDAHYVSPFKNPDRTQYLTFEPDQGGWNNIRMAMETVLAMSVAMGRTLVLPPDQKMYLIDKDKGTSKAEKQRNHFSFAHFFHMESISGEHAGLDIIDMETFLLREAMTGKLLDSRTRRPTFPPNNRTNWNGASAQEIDALNRWMRNTAHVMNWDPEHCMAVFAKSNDPKDWEDIERLDALVKRESRKFKDYKAYIGKPTPVDAPPEERMREGWAGRDSLCIYNKTVQEERHVHFPVGRDSRLLVHFYAFLFFQDWKDDLWMKRFVRDHVRYIDEIQCSAARVVAALRRRARERTKLVDPSYNGRGDFDTFHIRRGDFQYEVTRFDADVIYDVSKAKLTPNATVYIATDEKDRSFFKPMMKHYDIVFLDDFLHHLDGVNTNYFGMIDQLVASRGRIFFGCWFSTFTGYINRLRGYHADHHRTPGYEQGIVPSWYYALKDRYDHMQTFYPVKRSYYAREFPASWRLIDTGINGVKFDTRDHLAMTERRRR